jgi:hypothetical protein
LKLEYTTACQMPITFWAISTPEKGDILVAYLSVPMLCFVALATCHLHVVI